MPDDVIIIPRSKPGPRPVTCPTVKTSVRILGQAQIDTFRAMCALGGRRPHEMAADIILDAIRAARDNPDVQHLERAVRRHQSGLRVVRTLEGTR